ncbi:hypothetical protein PF005_g7992 [Phytophthora fragariae]|uniref:Uncharacterized protein n=1 Tax=Phytophthora fragariae TaxID=53985 RepID=A0A6A4DYY6_9STRA|nr:hypothetical protein PF003_g37236 [Phytophthora fragariae]KAE9001868.1 hypothetical protein PF011_g13559 [Phytophthora fragariae]KAE9100815.1 hypothetical protein PF010_g14680 [Phytophthora fragariae]KAE9117599.1 hypothetical protein PF007_g9228 [Phytophthora fragariae]KAE9140594.1 hypothetical protein PF006_g13508 [Phytophthora fragariae]
MLTPPNAHALSVPVLLPTSLLPAPCLHRARYSVRVTPCPLQLPEKSSFGGRLPSGGRLGSISP